MIKAGCLTRRAALLGGIVFAFGGSAQMAHAAPTAATVGDSGLGTLISVSPTSADSSGVNVASGALLYSMNVGALAYPNDSSDSYAQLGAIYNSQVPTGQTPWDVTASPEVALTLSASQITLTAPDAFTAVFTSQSGGTWTSTNSGWSLTDNSDGSYTATDPYNSTYNFNSAGTLTSWTDNNSGVTTTYAYTPPTSTPPTTPKTAGASPATVASQTALTQLTSSASSSEPLSFTTTLPSPASGPTYTVTDNAGDKDTLYTETPASSSETDKFTSAGAETLVGLSYNSAGLLSTISESNGTTDSITYSGNTVASMIVRNSSGTVTSGDTFSYQAPSSSICAADDIGETIVTPAVAANGPAITYCYTSAGVVDADNDATENEDYPSNSAGGTIMLSGPIDDAADSGTAIGSGSTYISADISAPSSTVGIASAELLIDGQDQNPSVDHFTQTCANGCDMYADFAVNTSGLTAGSHTATINVVASNGATSTATDTFTVNPSTTTDETIPTKAQFEKAYGNSLASSTNGNPPNWTKGLAYAWKWRDSYNSGTYPTQPDDCTDYVSQILNNAGMPTIPPAEGVPNGLAWYYETPDDSLTWDNSKDLVHMLLKFGYAENLHASFSWKPGDIIAYHWNTNLTPGNQNDISHVQFVYAVHGRYPYMLQHGAGTSQMYKTPQSWGQVVSRIKADGNWPDWWVHLRVVNTAPNLSGANSFPKS